MKKKIFASDIEWFKCKFENLKKKVENLHNKTDESNKKLYYLNENLNENLNNKIDEIYNELEEFKKWNITYNKMRDECEFIQQQVDLKIIMQMNIIKHKFNLMHEEASFAIFIEKIRKNNKILNKYEFMQQQVDLKIIMLMNMLTKKFILMQQEAYFKIIIERRLFRLRRKISKHLYYDIKEEELNEINDFYLVSFNCKIKQLPIQLQNFMFNNMPIIYYKYIWRLQQLKKICNLSYYKYYNIDWFKKIFDEDYYNALEFTAYKFYIETLWDKVDIYFNYIKKLYKHKVIYNIGRRTYRNYKKKMMKNKLEEQKIRNNSIYHMI